MEKTTALTCSEDGTMRVWDVMELTQKTVIKPQVMIYAMLPSCCVILQLGGYRAELKKCTVALCGLPGSVP
jgi:hypothetical protein